LDDLLAEAVRKLIPWLTFDQLITMRRRDILKLLASSSTMPLGGVDLLWHGAFSRVTNTTLSSLDDITTVLANRYSTSLPHMLVGPVMAHLEKASTLLSTTVRPSQRQLLESIVADAAIFIGVLSMHIGKLAQARAHLGLAEDMANQAGNKVLLAQVHAQQNLLCYYSQTSNENPQERILLLEHADQLAGRHAPAIVRMATSAWLAEDKAAAGDAYGAEEALDRSARALAQAEVEGKGGSGFCSSDGCYGGWGQDRFEGFRGAVELSLGRDRAIDTIRASLDLKTNPRWRATGLVDLAIALITKKQLEEACVHLIEAHTIGLGQGSAAILHHVFGARSSMPSSWNTLRCVRDLDEQLRVA
jgi:hypothetical protein